MLSFTSPQSRLTCGMLLALLAACQRPPPAAPADAAARLAAAQPGAAEAAPPPTRPAAPVAAAPVEVTDADRSAAAAMFAQRCTLCHGLKGHGNGPASASLSPRPRDLSLPAWQDSVTDETIRKVLLGGGPAIGKSLMMPANADLKGKPAVLEALVEVVRNLKR